LGLEWIGKATKSFARQSDFCRVCRYIEIFLKELDPQSS
jgi:hypothetical protein